MKLDLKFDLPFSENLNITTLDFELDTCNEVVDNPTKEYAFCEHKVIGFFENELLNSHGEDFNHHFDFEVHFEI